MHCRPRSRPSYTSGQLARCRITQVLLADCPTPLPDVTSLVEGLLRGLRLTARRLGREFHLPLASVFTTVDPLPCCPHLFAQCMLSPLTLCIRQLHAVLFPLRTAHALAILILPAAAVAGAPTRPLLSACVLCSHAHLVADRPVSLPSSFFSRTHR